MTSRDFCYWLQGRFELAGDVPLTPEQTETIRAHLAMVFAHEIDPSHGSPAHVEGLREIHDGPPKVDEKRVREIEKSLEEVRRQRAYFPHDLKLTC